MAPPTSFPPGTWTPDPARSRIGYSAGSREGSFDTGEVTLVVAEDGEAGIGAVVGGASFASTALRRDGDLLEVDGEVTINGRTLAVTASGTATEPDGALVLELRAAVDRRQFAIESEIGPEVAVEVRITLVRAPR